MTFFNKTGISVFSDCFCYDCLSETKTATTDSLVLRWISYIGSENSNEDIMPSTSLLSPGAGGLFHERKPQRNSWTKFLYALHTTDNILQTLIKLVWFLAKIYIMIQSVFEVWHYVDVKYFRVFHSRVVFYTFITEWPRTLSYFWSLVVLEQKGPLKFSKPMFSF